MPYPDSDPAAQLTTAKPAVQRLDAQALDKLRALDPSGNSGVVRRILSTFVTSAQRQRETFVAAQAAGDLVALGRIAHTVRPTAHHIGAFGLAQVADALERAVRAGTADAHSGPAAQFTAMLDEAVAATELELQA
jgi:two-component system, sensor histidine kinase and response regulator